MKKIMSVLLAIPFLFLASDEGVLHEKTVSSSASFDNAIPSIADVAVQSIFNAIKPATDSYEDAETALENLEKNQNHPAYLVALKLSQSRAALWNQLSMYANKNNCVRFATLLGYHARKEEQVKSVDMDSQMRNIGLVNMSSYLAKLPPFEGKEFVSNIRDLFLTKDSEKKSLIDRTHNVFNQVKGAFDNDIQKFLKALHAYQLTIKEGNPLAVQYLSMYIAQDKK